MAPIDFEKELQERLRSKEVKPSPEAWDRISARLEEEGPTPSGKPWGRIGLIAASVVLLLGFLFLWEPAGDSPKMDSVVESPDVEVPEEASSQPGQEVNSLRADVTDEAIVEGKPTTPLTGKDPDGIPPEVARNQGVEQAIVTESRVPGIEGVLPGTGSIGRSGPPLVVEEVVTELPEERMKDDEIEALLQQARTSIALQKEKDTLSAIDAMTLLDRAEDELDQTFREKVISKLKRGVGKFRTAVADRNK